MSYNHSTYPQDYLEWCFGKANNISEYTKQAQVAQMYSVKAQQELTAAEFYAARQERYSKAIAYDADDFESLPLHQVSTDLITKLLSEAACKQ